MRIIAAFTCLVLFAAIVGAKAQSTDSLLLKRGKKVYSRCIACHSPKRDRTGPRHCGVFGRKVGGVQGFRYSKTLANSTKVWNAEILNAFLKSPMTAFPGTTMGYAGIKKKKDRIALIAYLRSLTARSADCR